MAAAGIPLEKPLSARKIGAGRARGKNTKLFSEESISNIRRREAMAISELAGKPAPKEILIDPEELKRCYFEKKPNPSVRAERVRFGTGGHRGSPLLGTYTEEHI